MKKYLITEKQLDELKSRIETMLFVNYGDERDFKFFIEDIEAQELDVRIEDDIKSDTRKKLLVAVYIPKEQTR